MCFGGDPPAPVTPAAPPPPPPVLEQVAPDVASPTESEASNAAASGAKKYRSANLAITPGGAAGTSNNTGLGISM